MSLSQHNIVAICVCPQRALSVFVPIEPFLAWLSPRRTDCGRRRETQTNRGMYKDKCTVPCESIRPPWTLRPFATFQANIKIENCIFLWRINNKWDTIMKWDDIYWIFQTFSVFDLLIKFEISNICRSTSWLCPTCCWFFTKNTVLYLYVWSLKCRKRLQSSRGQNTFERHCK